MAYSPQQLAAFQAYLDPSADREAKLRQIADAYAPQVETPTAAPDLRLASADPVAVADAMPQAMDDATRRMILEQQQVGTPGGASVGQAHDIQAMLNGQGPAAAPPAPAPAPQVAPAQITDAELVQGLLTAPVPQAQPVGTAPVPAGMAPMDPAGGSLPGVPEQPPLPEVDAAGGAVLGAYLRSRLQGGPSAFIPAHDQPVNTVVQAQTAMNPADREAFDTSIQAEQGLNLEAGDTAAQAARDRAALLAQQEQDRRVEAAVAMQRQEAERLHLDHAERDYLDTVQQSEISPETWWGSKSTGGKIMAVLGGVLLGLTGRPDAVMNAIDADLARRRAERDVQLGAKRDRISSLRSRLMSPEAANSMERSMSLQIAATQMDRLGASAQSKEAQDRAALTAQHLRTEAEREKLKALQDEAGTYRTTIAHVPGRTVGGGGGLGAALAEAKRLGVSDPKEAMRLIAAGQFNPDKADKDQREATKDERERRVELPGGTGTYWANRANDAQEIQANIRAQDELMNSLTRLRAMAGKWQTFPDSEKRQIEAEVSGNLMRVSQLGGQGAMTDGERKVYGSLAGDVGGLTEAGAQDLLNARISVLRFNRDRVLSTLSTAPDQAPTPVRTTTAAIRGERPIE